MASEELLAASARREEELIAFAQDVVRTRSYSGEEEELARFISEKMRDLGYDEISIDRVGNVVGRLGDGPISIMFDAHMDTVEASDPDAWTVPPFSGEIKGGRLYGRGAVDMKGALASAVFGPVLANELGWIAGHTVYVTCTVNEEDCAGENLRSLFEELDIRPDFFVTCEPSSNEIALGHNGKAQIAITTKGVSAAASRPQNGVNAVYKMVEIIQRVEARNERLSAIGDPHGTITISNISSVSASLNAVPSECSIYLDRRMVVGETSEDIREEADALVEGTDATWEIGTLHSTSWTGKQIDYEPMNEAWLIETDHPLTQACRVAYEEVFDRPHGAYHVWVGGTNAVTPVAMGIPSIGFGPGEDFLSHVPNENCIVDEIITAAQFYAALIHKL